MKTTLPPPSRRNCPQERISNNAAEVADELAMSTDRRLAQATRAVEDFETRAPFSGRSPLKFVET